MPPLCPPSWSHPQVWSRPVPPVLPRKVCRHRVCEEPVKQIVFLPLSCDMHSFPSSRITNPHQDVCILRHKYELYASSLKTSSGRRAERRVDTFCATYTHRVGMQEASRPTRQYVLGIIESKNGPLASTTVRQRSIKEGYVITKEEDR